MKPEKDVLKCLENEVLEMKKEICLLRKALETGFISLHKEIEISKPLIDNNDGQKEFEMFKCKSCEERFQSEENLSLHISTNHGEEQFKCEFCAYTSKSKKGVKIHTSAKHRGETPPDEAIVACVHPPLHPIPCIRYEDGCQSLITDYYNIKYTAICEKCINFLNQKQLSSPFPPDLCPCCHQVHHGQGLPFSLCTECETEIQADGYTDSPWGSWHVDRRNGKIVCIDLDFN